MLLLPRLRDEERFLDKLEMTNTTPNHPVIPRESRNDGVPATPLVIRFYPFTHTYGRLQRRLMPLG
jgi:hypothetical protein